MFFLSKTPLLESRTSCNTQLLFWATETNRLRSTNYVLSLDVKLLLKNNPNL